MTSSTSIDGPPDRLRIVGDTSTRLWGLSGAERIARIATAQGTDVELGGAPVLLLANARFAFDPTWFRHVAASPGLVLTRGGEPVLAHLTSEDQLIEVEAAMAERRPLSGTTLDLVPAESAGTIEDPVLRKREQPFVDVLTPQTVPQLERASYFGAYKGVTDLLTKYLWPEWALALTRIAARIGLSPNMVTLIGLIFCIAAGAAFHQGHYWPGLAAGLVSMVLDTVDGKLARCTITSSKWGNVFDHGIDLVHPPIWWWAWAMGLDGYGTPLASSTLWVALTAVVAGYVVQRLIEGAFIARFAMHIHVWRQVDSQFRLITARRNPNMVILFAAMCIGRPDLGLLELAWWTVLSCLFHVVRLGQAYVWRARGRRVVSWLAGD